MPLRFAGHYHDTETGLYYNYNRYYNPDTGRYITTDPLGLTPSPNPHTYVTNPTTQIDPLGLSPEDHGLHQDDLLLSRTQGSRMTTPQATKLAEWLGYTRVRGASSHGQAVYTNGKDFISPDTDTHSLGVWKKAARVDGFSPSRRLGTYDFLLNWFAK